MLERLLPSTVIAVEAFGDVPGEPVFPGEWEYVERAVDGRREFVTARRCAREALARLGYPPAPIPRGPRREPQWPAGVVGSITHCAGYRAAAVASAEDIASAGIDAEPHEPLPAGVGAIVTSEEERAMLTRLPGDPSVHWDRLGSAPRSRSSKRGARSPDGSWVSTRRSSTSIRERGPSPATCGPTALESMAGRR